MWYKLLKSGQKQTAYRTFRNSIIHRGEVAFTPTKSEIVDGRNDLLEYPEKNQQPSFLKTTTGNGHFDIYYHPNLKFFYTKSNKPEYDRYSSFIVGMFTDEYPKEASQLVGILHDEHKKLYNEQMLGVSPPQDDMSDNINLAIKKTSRYIQQFIRIFMREYARPGVGISAAYRKQITADLLDAIPSLSQILGNATEAGYGELEHPMNVVQAHIRGIRNNLMRTPYTQEHLVNILVGFREGLREVIREDTVGLSGTQFTEKIQKMFENLSKLKKQEIEEITYKVIEEPSLVADIRLFIDNLS